MAITRRNLLKQTSLAALGAFAGGWSTISRAGERLIPWRNWSGGQACVPAARLAPANESELAEMLKSATGTVRAVGSGHSFSALVPTEGTLVSLSNLSGGVISHDAEKLQAEIWAGTRVADLGDPLKAIGQALPNMADIDYQTLAGAISTSTHGTGPKFGSYSTRVIGLRIVTAKGEVLDVDAEHHPEIFRAARVGLGALGVITRVRLQNRKAFRLKRHEWVGETEDLLAQMPKLIADNEHFEINSLLHSDVSIATALNETPSTQTLPKEGGGDMEKVKMIQAVDRWFGDSIRMQAALYNFTAKHVVPFPDVIDDSYKVFANVRDVRFNEMEYSVPAEHGPACLRELLGTIRTQNLHSYIPIEYRYVKADDIPLSMFQGRDTCAISVHQHYTLDYHNFFAAVEPIFWKYDGRPHWGKLHTLNHNQLSRLYPRMKEFLEVRAALDPAGKFLNGHLRSVLGVNC